MTSIPKSIESTSSSRPGRHPLPADATTRIVSSSRSTSACPAVRRVGRHRRRPTDRVHRAHGPSGRDVAGRRRRHTTDVRPVEIGIAKRRGGPRRGERVGRTTHERLARPGPREVHVVDIGKSSRGGDRGQHGRGRSTLQAMSDGKSRTRCEGRAQHKLERQRRGSVGVQGLNRGLEDGRAGDARHRTRPRRDRVIFTHPQSKIHPGDARVPTGQGRARPVSRGRNHGRWRHHGDDTHPAYAILGHNIAYSVSPLQGSAFAAVKLPHTYSRADVETVEEFVEGQIWNDDNFGGVP